MEERNSEREPETGRQRGELFVLSAPSGTGKTTLIRSLLDGGLERFGELYFSVSHTTRPPRPGEVDGRDYHFVDAEAFRQMIVSDRFLEWAEVHRNYYGTSYDEVLPRLEAGMDVIMDIDVQGAERVLKSHPESHSIFIMPPSYADLQRRLAQRGLDDLDEVARRLAVSVWEIKRYNQYQYVIINDDLERAADVLAAIILEKRHRLSRIGDRAEQVLNSFAAAAGREGMGAEPDDADRG